MAIVCLTYDEIPVQRCRYFNYDSTTCTCHHDLNVQRRAQSVPFYNNFVFHLIL